MNSLDNHIQGLNDSSAPFNQVEPNYIDEISRIYDTYEDLLEFGDISSQDIEDMMENLSIPKMILLSNTYQDYLYPQVLQYFEDYLITKYKRSL